MSHRPTSAPFTHRLRGYDVYEAGHPVRRVLPSPELSMVGPFVLFDHFGPAQLAPGEGVSIAPHAHAHFATFTYFFGGGSLHEDDLGNRALVEPGDVAWMHAGSGITHSERTPDAFRATGGVGHGIQAWVALPEELETTAPSFQLARADEIPVSTVGGATLRVLVGEMGGARSPIETCSPVLVVELRTGARAAEIPLTPASDTRAVFFVEGFGAIDRHRIGVGTLVVLRDASTPVLRLEPDTCALLFGGASLGRRYLQGNFVASNEARLEKARRELGCERD